MTIHFKNGETKEISDLVADILKNRILEGAAKFQIFMNEKKEASLFINIEEIVYID